MNLVRMTTILILAFAAGTAGVAWAEEGGASPQAKAGQFSDYKPQGFLSDYSKLKPEGSDSDV